MLKHDRYSRRTFLEVLAGTSAAAAVSPYLAWLPAGAQRSAAKTRFAYFASWAPQGSGIHVFAADRRLWTRVQFVRSESPSAFAVSADQRTLFVANCTRHFQGLPTASVESYRIDASSGELALISRVPLALSAVEPGHLAVSPDGQYLAVAVTGGGSYNLLPIAPDGSLGAVAVLRKEIGCGPDPLLQACARPGQLAFDREGHLLTTDLGADRVTAFRPVPEALHVVARRPSRAGSGPSSLAFHPGSGLLFVGNALDGTIGTHPYSPATGTIEESTLVSAAPGASARLTGLALHPSGQILVSASQCAQRQSQLTAWRIDAGHATLRPCDTAPLQARVAALACTPDGQSLVALEESGSATLLHLDAASARFGSTTVIASVPDPKAVVLTHL